MNLQQSDNSSRQTSVSDTQREKGEGRVIGGNLTNKKKTESKMKQKKEKERKKKENV